MTRGGVRCDCILARAIGLFGLMALAIPLSVLKVGTLTAGEPAPIFAGAPLALADTDEPTKGEPSKVETPAAKPEDGADKQPAEKEKPEAAKDKKSDAGEKAKSKTESAADKAAARRKLDNEYYELYKSLADTMDQVERNYVKPVDRRELMEAAIRGMLETLDPYSNYIDPDQMNSFRTSVESQFGGIGIQVTVEDNQLKVTSPLVGTPAYRAGVQAGDKIIKIEGEPTNHLTIDDAVRKLKGESGTSVTFTVQHALSGKTDTYTLKREVIHLDTVLGDRRKADDSWDFMLDPEKKIGYIRLTAFSRDTAADLKKALEDLQARKMRGLILDLRFNPGGLLTSAVEICDLFINDGRIVSTKGRNATERVWDAVAPGTFQDFPMVVLVNHYSASASEIVSACLQDHHRAVIIGDRSWGKGSVQNVIELESGRSALKLTTATYARPNGHNIHRFPDSKETDEWGVKPDDGYEVKLSNRELSDLLMDRRHRDVVLAHADEPAVAEGNSSAAEHGDKDAQSKSGSQDSADVKTEPQDKQDKQEKTSKDQAKPTETPAHSEDSGDKSPADDNSKLEKREESEESKSEKSTDADVAAPGKPVKFVDRQLQKAIEYLTTEIAKAP